MRDSPWQIPNVKTASYRSLDAAGLWSRGGEFPRDWGSGQWKLLKLAMDGKAKKLKAHEYLVMFVSGMFATLAAWPRDDNSPNPLAKIVGDLTTIIRELTSHKIIPQVR